MELNERIKLYREKCSMTKSELARAIGVSPSYITKLESGEKANPSLEIQFKIAKTLGIPLNELTSSIKSDVRYTLNNNVDFRDIKKYREKLNLSQETLSELIGIKLEDLKGLEAGTIPNPRIDYAVRLNDLFKPDPPFCYEQISELFNGTGTLAESLNKILNNGVYQSTECRLDKKLILTSYIERFADDRNITLTIKDKLEICDFLTQVIDPLLEHKVMGISNKNTNKE